jgi:hypothetical protein
MTRPIRYSAATPVGYQLRCSHAFRVSKYIVSRGDIFTEPQEISNGTGTVALSDRFNCCPETMQQVFGYARATVLQGYPKGFLTALRRGKDAPFTLMQL